MPTRYVTEAEKTGQKLRQQRYKEKKAKEGIIRRSFFLNDVEHFIIDAIVQIMRDRPENLPWLNKIEPNDREALIVALKRMAEIADEIGPARSYLLRPTKEKGDGE